MQNDGCVTASRAVLNAFAAAWPPGGVTRAMAALADRGLSIPEATASAEAQKVRASRCNRQRFPPRYRIFRQRAGHRPRGGAIFWPPLLVRGRAAPQHASCAPQRDLYLSNRHEASAVQTMRDVRHFDNRIARQLREPFQQWQAVRHQHSALSLKWRADNPCTAVAAKQNKISE